MGLWTIPRHLNLRQARERVRFFVKSEVSIAWKFAGQFILTSSWAYVIQYLMAIVLTIAAIGVFNLAVLAMGPLSVAAVGLQSAMISVAAKKFRDNASKTLRFIFLVATATAAVTALWMLLIYAIPVHDLKKALGPTWPQARSILLWVGLGVTISQWSGAGAAGLRALRAGKANLWLAVVLVPGLLVPVMVGAELNGLHGAVVGFAIANGIVALLTWITLRWSAHRFVAAGGSEGIDDAGRGSSDEVDALTELHPEAMVDPVFGIPMTTPTTS